MTRFPTVLDLAEADEEDVNAHWAGLGFYRRARMLHAGAKYVRDKCDGTVPSTVPELLKINGIGRYTASAIASIAYGQFVPVVDGNVCRVLSRLTGIANHIKSPTLKDDWGWVLARQIVTAGRCCAAGGGGGNGNEEFLDGTPSEVNQALMELGATYCSPSGTGMDANDPLVNFYLSTRLGRGFAATFMGAVGAEKLQRGVDKDNEKDEGTMETESMPTMTVMATNTLEEYISNASQVRKQSWNEKRMIKKCAICDEDGISTALLAMADALGVDPSLSLSSYLEKRSVALTDVVDDDDAVAAAAAAAGHAALPIAPPKKDKREDVLAVAAISRRYRRRVRARRTKDKGDGDSDDDDGIEDDDEDIDKDTAWLMVRRPKDGLLAGQWEFPSVCVWTSDSVSGVKGEGKDGTFQTTNANRKKSTRVKEEAPGNGDSGRSTTNKGVHIPPVISSDVRRKALDSFLCGISLLSSKSNTRSKKSSCASSSSSTSRCSSSSSIFICDREQLSDSPLEHIFSHVRHTMWVEHVDMVHDETWCNTAKMTILRTDDGRDVRWMTEGDMKSVGITSGVKKVLNAVKDARKRRRRRRRAEERGSMTKKTKMRQKE